MSGVRKGETRPQGLAQNMSAPPRSTFTFQPYGTQAQASKVSVKPQAGGLVWRLSVDPDALLAAHAPAVSKALARLRRQALTRARKEAPGAAPEAIATQHLARLRGLIELAGRLAGVRPTDTEAPIEALLDRLADLAPHLPRPDLPALGVVERTPQAEPSPHPPTTDLAAGLWLLTHVNGRTFDRDGPATLVPGLAEGGRFDLYCA